MAYKIKSAYDFSKRLVFDGNASFMAGIQKKELLPIDITLHFWVVYYKRYTAYSLTIEDEEFKIKKTHRYFYASPEKKTIEEIEEILKTDEDYQVIRQKYLPTIERIQYLGCAKYKP